MSGFYGLPVGYIGILYGFAFLTVLVQATAICTSSLRWRHARRYWIEIFTEVFALAGGVGTLLILARVLTGVRSGWVLISGFRWLRIGTLAGITVCTVLAIWDRGSNGGLVLFAAAFLLTPFCERFAGERFPLCLVGAMLLWLAHGLAIAVRRIREIRRGITSVSVKEAMDSIPTAVMFYRADGDVLHLNEKMRMLEFSLFGVPERNGNAVFEALRKGSVKPECIPKQLEPDPVYELPDGTVWLFSKVRLHIPHCDIRQLTAKDITEHWRTGEALERENRLLREKGEELKGQLDRLRSACMEEERQKARNRVHDVLGQKVSMLLRTLRQQEQPDASIFAAFADGLPDSLRAASPQSSPLEALELLEKTMETIGVEIRFSGAFCAEKELLRLSMDIITEAVTNAVRHGFATEIQIRFQKEKGGYRLIISDNGLGAGASLKEGVGLSSMRQKLTAIGGSLELSAARPFTLTAILPEVQSK